MEGTEASTDSPCCIYQLKTQIQNWFFKKKKNWFFNLEHVSWTRLLGPGSAEQKYFFVRLSIEMGEQAYPQGDPRILNHPPLQ